MGVPPPPPFGFSLKLLLSIEIVWPSRWIVIIKKCARLKPKFTSSKLVIHHLCFRIQWLLLHMSSPIAKFVECSREEIVQAYAQPKSDICHICRVFTWKEHGRCYILRFHCRFASNFKWSSSKQVFIACCSSFDIVARTFKWTLTLQ